MMTGPLILLGRHNFYVFPRKELPVHGPSYEFLCQTTSIDFLAKYQFDFNTCIREGAFSNCNRLLPALCAMLSRWHTWHQ